MNSSEEDIIIEVEIGNDIVQCTVIAAFDVETHSYIALLPHIGDEDEVVIYRYIELDGDEIEISGIEEDEEFERALDKFDSLIEDSEEEEIGDYF